LTIDDVLEIKQINKREKVKVKKQKCNAATPSSDERAPL